ncbi:hypothetical protein [Mucilaginibacter lappiensis]|uniref:hypothetical protein n=1 Tax=Mucilaginibacter lappiensis TaxID=354630 RepID=UPI003D1E8378
MSEELALAIAYLIFALISWGLYKVLITKKQAWVVAISLIIYLIGLYYYFETVNKLHQYLRNNKIMNIEFGHASLDLLILMLFCYINAFILIGLIIRRRNKNVEL